MPMRRLIRAVTVNFDVECGISASFVSNHGGRSIPFVIGYFSFQFSAFRSSVTRGPPSRETCHR
jgi:hypothetical protein